MKSNKTNLTKTYKGKETVRFIPNFAHIKDAIKQLPNADSHNNDTISIFIPIDKKYKEIAFVKKRIQRGSKEVLRWAFEGKFLVRDQDVEQLRD